MTELRKCPFCGGEATASEIQDTWQNDTRHWYILCDECSCCLGGYGEFTTEEEAIEAWNKRVSCDTCAMYFPDDGCMAGLAEGEVQE